MLRRFLLLICIVLTGCQAIIYGTATDFEKISLGMTKQQVIQAIGEPAAIGADADKGEEYLTYKRMRHVVSDWPRTYMVILRSGKIVKYGEVNEDNQSRDALTATVLSGAIHSTAPAPQPYIMPIRPTTNCNSTVLGNTVNTNCR